jgi:outer membrane protein OmpA-like peptidoglycan-associated protein
VSRSVPVALATTLALCTFSGVALAAPSTVQVIVGGEAYDGPPKLEVTFNGEVLGQAAVTDAIDTASVGRFADAKDRTAYVQSFQFAIPEAVFKPTGEVRVRLINEAYGGEGSNRDRNLYLAAVVVNGRAVTVSGLSTKGKSPDLKNELIGEFLVLHDGNVEGVSTAPAGGWPQPGTEVAAAMPAAPEPVVPVAASERPEPAADAPVVVASVKAPDKEAAQTVDPIETASLRPSVDIRGGACNEVYNVTGFNESSNDLTPKLMQRLDEIIKDIGPQKCKLRVVGYSSVQGTGELNTQFAVERAQKVAGYLREQKLGYLSLRTSGGGGTEEFGDLPSDNRRVVITMTP